MILRRGLMLLTPVFLAGVLCSPAECDDNLDDLLEQVGEQYAQSYIAPLVHGWGANQNSGLFHTAAIPRSRLTLSIGLKFMGTRLNEDDQVFRRVLEVDDIGEYFPGYGGRGTIVLEGPTVVGDSDTMGRMTGYVNGLPVVSMETIEGLVNTRWIPLAAPELQVGGFHGLKVSLRWLPEITIGDFGKTKYMGWGLQWNPGFLLPPLPVDVMVGFFRQEINLGTVVETTANSVFVAASKNFALATLYGGLAAESSTMKVSYTEQDSDVDVEFEMDGDMSARLTLGATFNLGAKLNVEMGVGNLTVYTAGLMFGF
jgi:hypothetical protein